MATDDEKDDQAREPEPKWIAWFRPAFYCQWNGAEPRPTSQLTAEEFLSRDVSDAAKRADELYSRSTLLLAGGIIMAFIGITIFYLALPQVQPGERPLPYWPKSVRATGMLVFVEGIAWFLLRQYRALIEDYKAFYRLYLKRANYLVAFKTLDTKELGPTRILLAASVMSEDLTGKLKAGETTENIEAVKAIEPNPVFQFFQAALGTIKKDDK